MNNPSEAPQTVWLISANHLLCGDLVYLDGNNGWTRQLSSAQHLTDKEDAKAHLSIANSHSSEVLGAEMISAQLNANNEIELSHFRDRFRESGPTHRSDLFRSASTQHQTDCVR